MNGTYNCAVAACPGGAVKKETLNRAYDMGDGKHVIIYSLPVIICVNCGELTFSIDDIEKASAMVFDDEQPPKRVTIPALEFARSEMSPENLLLTTKS